MIDLDNGSVRAVAWNEVFPWLCLFRTFRLAIRPRMLALSAVAIVLTVVGWSIIGHIFSGTDNPQLAEHIEAMAEPTGCPWRNLAALVPDRPAWSGVETANPIEHVWKELSLPFIALFDAEATPSFMAYWLLCSLWALLVWAVFGAGITRTAAVALAADERVSWAAMLGHVKSRWTGYFTAPLWPLLGVVLAALPIVCAGCFMRWEPTIWIGAILWPIFLGGGVFMAVLLLGLLFGWPLMWATISTEGTDSFDALSRSYAYTFQRPLHYLLYTLVAGVLGVLGWLLVSNFAAGVIHVTYWAASFGAGRERIAAVMTGETLGVIGGAGATLLRVWVDVVRLLAVGFLYSYFWTAATAIYFLLRRDVDATEMDEVFLEDQEEDAQGLPPVETDAQGAPVVDNDTP